MNYILDFFPCHVSSLVAEGGSSMQRSAATWCCLILSIPRVDTGSLNVIFQKREEYSQNSLCTARPSSVSC